LVCTVDYFAWNKFYVYADAPGYQAKVLQVPREVKIVPVAAGLCLCWPALAWAYGPAQTPIHMALEED
jgi:hypothetical protein